MKRAIEQPAGKPVGNRAAGTEQGSNLSQATQRRVRHREVSAGEYILFVECPSAWVSSTSKSGKGRTHEHSND